MGREQNMYGLPKDFDCAFLVGRTLEMICFAANQIYLHFDQKIMITIEGEYSFQKERVAPLQILVVPAVECNLMTLLEQSVISASGKEDGTLALVFQNGSVFRCYDRTENYESYRIKNGKKITIV